MMGDEHRNEGRGPRRLGAWLGDLDAGVHGALAAFATRAGHPPRRLAAAAAWAALIVTAGLLLALSVALGTVVPAGLALPATIVGVLHIQGLPRQGLPRPAAADPALRQLWAGAGFSALAVGAVAAQGPAAGLLVLAAAVAALWAAALHFEAMGAGRSPSENTDDTRWNPSSPA